MVLLVVVLLVVVLLVVVVLVVARTGLLPRLEPYRVAGRAWEEAVTAAHLARVSLSSTGFYSTPGLHYDFKWVPSPSDHDSDHNQQTVSSLVTFIFSSKNGGGPKSP